MRTLILSIGCLPVLIYLRFWIGVAYIALHFLSKFW